MRKQHKHLKRSAKVYKIDVFKVSMINDHYGIDLWSYDRRVGLGRYVSKVSIAYAQHAGKTAYKVHERQHYHDYPLF